MIEYIDKRLQEWARWRVGGRRLQTKTSPGWTSLVPSGKENHPPEAFIPYDDLRCAEIDRCVCALMPTLRMAVIEGYCRIGGADAALKRCGFSKATYYRHLDSAHHLILGWLNDLACGVDVPPWEDDGPNAKEQAMTLLTRRPGDIDEHPPMLPTPIQ